MGIPPRALELEQQSLGTGNPALGEAYEMLRNQWRDGDRDRDLGLHLMFLAWYLEIEPAHLTGRNNDRAPTAQLQSVFAEVYDHFADSIEGDAEMLYVVG
jgi:hypothetical protein